MAAPPPPPAPPQANLPWPVGIAPKADEGAEAARAVAKRLEESGSESDDSSDEKSEEADEAKEVKKGGYVFKHDPEDMPEMPVPTVENGGLIVRTEGVTQAMDIALGVYEKRVKTLQRIRQAKTQ